MFEEQKLSAEELKGAMVRLMDRAALDRMAKLARESSADNACDILMKEIV